MRLAVYQPHLLPCLHFWNRMCMADVFVLLDTAQFVRRSNVGDSLQNFTYVRTQEGAKKKLTLPVPHTGQRTLIKDTPVGSIPEFIASLQATYRKQPYFDVVRDLLTKDPPGSTLGSVSCTWIERIHQRLSEFVDMPKLVRSSSLPVEGKASDWMLNFCNYFHADTYVCGKAAFEEYLDKQAFSRAGVNIVVQDWTCPSYPQGKEPFISNLSIVDPLVRLGLQRTADLIRHHLV